MRPGRHTNQAFYYCLAEAAARFGIVVHCAVANSNHYHAVVRDPQGRLPEFLAHFHRMLAKVMNCHWGRWESFFASEQTSRVECVDAADGFGRMIYTLANPVKDQLVERAHHWPGATSLHAQLADRPMRIRRPHWFFDKEGAMPLEVELRFERLPGYEDLSHEAWASMISEAVAEEERAAAAARSSSGGRILGRKAVLRQSPLARPKSHEPRRGLKPRIAARNRWRRVEALQRDKEWLASYREAFARRREGEVDVLFPAGTYKLRVLGLVLCAA